LEEAAILSHKAAGSDGIIRHRADAVGSQRWAEPPRTQAAPMYVPQVADDVGAIPV
jgi:hypothetical protein